MTRDRFLHILRFLHFADNSERPDQDEEYDRLWKLRTVFDTLHDNYAKFYNPSENLAVDEIIVKFRVIFRHYIPNKRKRFGIKIYKLCDEAGYISAMRVYLGKDSHCATDDITATHATARHLTRRVEGLGHKLFMDNFFSSPRLFDDLDRHKINSCGTVRPNRKKCPVTLDKKAATFYFFRSYIHIVLTVQGPSGVITNSLAISLLMCSKGRMVLKTCNTQIF
jgi:hypothetical protein